MFTTLKPRPRRAKLWLLAVLAVAVALPAVSAPAALAAKKPTVVLVHGAWADASGWDGVIGKLHHAGYTVVALANPLRGLASDSGYIASYLKSVSGPIVLVGHSYGGAVITNAAAGNANVKALVYVDAFIPAEGDTLLALVSSAPGSALGGDPAKVFDFAQDPALPPSDPDTYVKQSVFPGAFANDLPKAVGVAMAAAQRPLAAGVLNEKSGSPAWKTIPSWAVVGTIDKVIPPAALQSMATRAGAHITKIKAGHLSMVSQPGAVSKVILKAAKSVG